jgi:hypothetical protein
LPEETPDLQGDGRTPPRSALAGANGCFGSTLQIGNGTISSSRLCRTTVPDLTVRTSTELLPGWTQGELIEHHRTVMVMATAPPRSIQRRLRAAVYRRRPGRLGLHSENLHQEVRIEDLVTTFTQEGWLDAAGDGLANRAGTESSWVNLTPRSPGCSLKTSKAIIRHDWDNQSCSF